MPEMGPPAGEGEGTPPSPGGETTVLPPVAVIPGQETGKVFLVGKAASPGPAAPLEVPLPMVPPRKPVPPPRQRRPLRWWCRQALPVVGLALMIGCLWGLFAEFPTLDVGPRGGDEPGLPPGPSASGGVVAVVIDPGHGGTDTGATALGLQEKWLNLDVARRVAGRLERAGVGVRMTRATDQAISLEERVRIANGTPGAIFVSIHFNDAFQAERGQGAYHASGVETFYSERKEAGLLSGDWMWTSLFGGGGKNPAGLNRRDAAAWSARQGAALADAIQGSLVGATSAADRGTKERGLYVTRRVRAPAVLVEGGFISHPAEAKRLGDSAYRQKLADAIAAGILQYLQTTATGQSTILPTGA